MTKTEHLLLCVMEECAEVSQRASKALRFGLEEIQPGQQLTNAQRLVLEYADLYAVFEMLGDEYPHLPRVLTVDVEAKKAKVKQFLHYSEQCGTLSATPARDRS